MPYQEPSSLSVAPLETVDFSRLVTRDEAEISKLLVSCQTHGFFYLDLQNAESRTILEDAQQLVRIMENYFAQPLEAKMKDDRQSLTLGFCAIGIQTGVFEGSKDGVEGFKVPLQEMVEKSPRLPETVHKNAELFDTFISITHYISMTIVSCLSDALGLQNDRRLEQSHREGEPTNTTLMLMHYPHHLGDANVGQNKHTDSGSLTFILCEQWGLQVMTPETNTWCYVPPRSGHAVINMGDSLRFLSGKRLYSAVHRVLPPGWQKESRYSIAYFLRPEKEAKFEDTDGNEVSAAKWHDKKYSVFRQPHAKQAENDMVTGGMEKIIVN